MTKTNIYTVGGAVQAGGGIYIRRRADEDLFRLCREGTFAYILYTRQVGKSSLMFHAAERLEAEGVRTVIIDLNQIGTQVTPEAWYLGLLAIIEEHLSLTTDVVAWWQHHAHLGMTQRLTLFFEEVLIKEVAEPIVIFVDEIDTTLSLKFTDDFFAAIRYLYHARAQVPEFRRLSFVLSGVATPSDLIQDPQRTPFNIGQRVELTDFTFEETLPLADGLGLPPDSARQVLRWVLKWTGGHPYLTQRTCAAIAEQRRNGWTEADVDESVANLFLGEKSQQDDNLRFVRDMLTERIPASVNVSDVLTTYREVRRNRRPVPDEERSLVKSHLKLSAGIVRRTNGALHVRNRIYGEVFDEDWVKEHLPEEWQRRNRQKLILRAVAGLVLILLVLNVPVGIYAWSQRNQAVHSLDEEKNLRRIAEERRKEAVEQRREARKQAEEARKQTFIAETNERRAKDSEQQAKFNLQKARDQSARAERLRRVAEAEKRKAQEAAKREGEAKRRAEKAAEKEKLFRQRAEDAARAEKGIRATLIAQQPGREIEALVLAVQAVGPSLQSGRTPSAQAVEGLTSAITAAKYSLPLRGHTALVHSAAFSPDGALIVTASEDRTARLWDARTGAAVKTLQERLNETTHTSSVNIAAFSPDGKLIVTASSDNTAKVWDRHSGKLIATLKGHQNYVDSETDARMRGYITSAAFSPDSARVVTASYDFTARIWDARTGEAKFILRGHKLPLMSAAFSPNGAYVVTASWDELRLWDAKTGEFVRTFQPPVSSPAKAAWDGARIFTVNLDYRPSRFNSVAFSPDGTRVVVADYDGRVHLWDAPSGKFLRSFEAHSDVTRSAVFSPDGKRILTASHDRTVRIWDADRGDLLTTLQGHSDMVTSVAISRDGSRIVSASGDKTARLWSPSKDSSLMTLRGHSGAVNTAIFSSDGARILTASWDHTAKIWNARTGELLTTLDGHSETVWSAVFPSDDKRILTASKDGTARLWGARTGALLSTFKSATGLIWSAAMSPDGSRIVTTSTGSTAELWNPSDPRKPIATLRHVIATTPEQDVGYRGDVRSAAFSPNSERVVTASVHDKAARLWDSRSGRFIAALEGHQSGVNSVTFAPDGTRIVTTSADRTARLWDGRTGSLLKTLTGHTALVNNAAFSPDSARVVTAGGDGTARLWDARTGKPLKILSGHTSSVVSVAFSPDGSRIATAGNDNTARLWDARTAELLATFQGHTAPLYSVTFSPDGLHILTASEDSTAKIFPTRVTDFFTTAANLLRSQPEFEKVQQLCEPYLKPTLPRQTRR